jgi:hypothetical protein
MSCALSNGNFIQALKRTHTKKREIWSKLWMIALLAVTVRTLCYNTTTTDSIMSLPPQWLLICWSVASYRITNQQQHEQLSMWYIFFPIQSDIYQAHQLLCCSHVFGCERFKWSVKFKQTFCCCRYGVVTQTAQNGRKFLLVSIFHAVFLSLTHFSYIRFRFIIIIIIIIMFFFTPHVKVEGSSIESSFMTKDIS